MSHFSAPSGDISCDIFCAVVDNLGDAGVCWRLARQLAAEHGWAVRLWINNLTPLTLLRPGIEALRERQVIDGVDIRQWPAQFPNVRPAQVVIEAFACELPQIYVAAMAAQTLKPVWLNLEYLSAEDWVVGCHGLASPHPTLPLVKHFFFPGFVAGTGGLLREKEFAVPLAPTFCDPLTVSLFCYDNPALPRLLDLWAQEPATLTCLVAEGLPRRQAEAWLGTGFAVGTEFRRGALTLRALPFVPQPAYDSILAGCNLNFVRGEDSFVRAQWAERPFVWQIYPQDGNAHRPKLDAFLAHYSAGLDLSTSAAVAAFWQAWNGGGDLAHAWPAFRTAIPRLATQAPSWVDRIRQPGDLAANLVAFSESRP